MASTQLMSIPFRATDGVSGIVTHPFRNGPDGAMAELLFDDGRRAYMHPSVLQLQQDGSYILPLQSSDLNGQPLPQAAVVPLVHEQLELHKHRVETGKIRVVKSVVVEDQVVDLPVTQEEVTVERVAVERFVTEPPPIRREGDVTIISLLEEVVVVEKRLMVREEIRLTTRRLVSHEPHAFSLRKEVATVDRVTGE